jgi:hypothetical protein
MVLAIQARIVAAEVVDRAGPQFLAQRLDLCQVQRLAEHDLAGAELLEVIRFALLAGQRHDVVAARGKHVDGEAADAAGGAGDDDRTIAGLQAVLFHAHDAEARGEACGAEGHGLGARQPDRQLVHPVRREFARARHSRRDGRRRCRSWLPRPRRPP